MMGDLLGWDADQRTAKPSGNLAPGGRDAGAQRADGVAGNQRETRGDREPSGYAESTHKNGGVKGRKSDAVDPSSSTVLRPALYGRMWSWW